MNNKNFDVVIDFGSSRIRVAAIKKDNKKISFYYQSDYFSDPLKAKSEMEKIIPYLEKDTNEYLDSINLMVDSTGMLSINLSIFKSFDGSKLKKEDIQFLIQEAKQQVLRNYSDQSIMHIIVKKYKIDGKDYTLMPQDIICYRLSIDIIFISLPKKTIHQLKEFFFNLDISINQIFYSSYAKSINYKDNFTSIGNISFIDMGYNKTSITHYDEIIFLQVLPIGGNYITKDLSKVLNIDLAEAEKIKIDFVKNKSGSIDKNFSLDLIQKIIFARVEEILELCDKSIKLNRNLEKSSKFKMVLMGEGSKILDNKFKEKISFPQEIDLLEETKIDICNSAFKLLDGSNKQEVVIIPKKLLKEGFFEKLFHFFK